jgi:hypothetical protein
MTGHTRVVFTIQFAPTRSPALATTLRLARQADVYTDTPDGVHRAEFTLRAESVRRAVPAWHFWEREGPVLPILFGLVLFHFLTVPI